MKTIHSFLDEVGQEMEESLRAQRLRGTRTMLSVGPTTPHWMWFWGQNQCNGPRIHSDGTESIAVHPKRFTIMWGGLSSTTTSVQHPLGWCDSCHRTTAPVRSPHTSYRWRGERVIEPIKWMGIIRRPWLTKANGGNLARTPGLHPTLYEKCHGIFNDHSESGPRFNISSERRCSKTR